MLPYAKAVWRYLEARAVWQPGQGISAGDYGYIKNGCFIRDGSIWEHFRIDPRQIEEQVSTDYEFSSAAQKDQGAKGYWGWLQKVAASLCWSDGEGLFMSAKKSSLQTLVNLATCRRRLLEKCEEWPYSRFVVHQVCTLENGVVALGQNWTVGGQLHLNDSVQNGGIVLGEKQTGGLTYCRKDVNGAVYVHVVRLKPLPGMGAAPPPVDEDADCWVQDDFKDLKENE